MLEFIDTHCHIIPGVDDGPPDMDTSLAMARMAMADGITDIVATPHIVEGYYDGSDREQRLAQLRKIFTSAGIDLRLSAGVTCGRQRILSIPRVQKLIPMPTKQNHLSPNL